MRKGIRIITDAVTTKKGMWITLVSWLMVMTLLMVFTPGASDYKVGSVDSLPDDAKSVIAQNKIDQYFEGADYLPALLVYQSDEGEINPEELYNKLVELTPEKVEGLQQIIPFEQIPPEAVASFLSEDRTTGVVPFGFDSNMEIDALEVSLEQVTKISEQGKNLSVTITGPAGIAVDTVNLFSRADIVLILSTVGLILILLIIIYRSPLLALIPLLAAGFVYGVVNQILGLFGAAGLPLASQSLSIMSILLFAAVIDYSLFVFSRYREELKKHESKFESMRYAMRETGTPVFYSGGTVLAAMLVLFFAEFGDYQNFAPIFGTTMFVVMISSITLVPALFTLFGRKSFWPKIPKVGDGTEDKTTIWHKIGKFVVRKPAFSAIAMGIILLVSASNVFHMTYSFDTIKSFPEDMPSREGYEVLEEQFAKGDLAPTTVLFEAKSEVSEKDQQAILTTLQAQPLVRNVQINAVSGNAVQYSVTFEESPYAIETMDALEGMMEDADKLVAESSLEGKLYFAGETATQIDDRSVNNRDLIVVVVLETILILAMLFFLTRSIKMPIYMMGTILLSFLAALGLGMFLTDVFFDIESISNRVPLYSFVFLVALGIDYNIILISRYLEERKKHAVKEAVEIAVAKTGGVISSAGLILAATFAVLMTQPIQILFVFGFIVAIGILLDTFLIRGVLMPALIVMLEKDKENIEQGS
ncbi:MMPL family transporter [Salirhabdus sp. Marseille-P4669]|uniref:MMPL family transporter n=1 Tax=Salirhabdus sp. Marseille-P4669 TaxID=2042310 RepID=UPI000C7AA3AA|nr:MMPL family transporter [Salirhabdus sp. Marseille-P4669]